MIAQKDQHWRTPGLCLFLAAITFAVFGQTLTHGFIDFDDNEYVYENPMVAGGLTLQGIIRAFTSIHAANWHPLTWISHELDCQIYGLHPGGHHLTNILLHTATVIVLFLVLRQMTGALWRSAFVAAVFAIHPLRVESVAWVAERKDVLSGLFFMLTIGAYVRYAENLKFQISNFKFFYIASVVLFALGLMAKPMLVTLPLVLLLLDYWPLQRVESRKLSGLVLEKLPLLALSAASCVVTLLAQSGAIHSGGSFSLPLRLGNALAAFMVYLGQMVYPAGLALLYPFPHNGIPGWELGLAATLLAGFSAVAIWLRRKQPWLLMGWLWYLVMLLPVVGIIQVGGQAHADRYTYLPQIGIYVALTWMAAEWRLSRVAGGGLMAGVLAMLMLFAWKQTAYWKDNETLWTHTLACTTDNEVAHYNLGGFYAHHARMDEAIAQYREALHIKPDKSDAQYNLGLALAMQHKTTEAIAHYRMALGSQSAMPEALNNLAWILATDPHAEIRNGAEAVQLARRACALTRDSMPMLIGTLAAAYAEAGYFDEAIASAQKAHDLAVAQGCGDVAAKNLELLKLFRSHHAYHEKP